MLYTCVRRFDVTSTKVLSTVRNFLGNKQRLGQSFVELRDMSEEKLGPFGTAADPKRGLTVVQTCSTDSTLV